MKKVDIVIQPLYYKHGNSNIVLKYVDSDIQFDHKQNNEKL